MKIRLSLALLLVLVSFCANADESNSLSMSATAAIQYSGSSSLHGFKGTAKPDEFAVHVERVNGKKELLSVDVSVPVISMNSGSKGRDGKMRKMLDSIGSPSLVGHIEQVEITQPDSKEEQQLIPLSIVIRNATNEVQATMTEWQLGEGELTFELEFNLSLKAFNLKPPRLPFMKVSDDVTVTVQVQGQSKTK